MKEMPVQIELQNTGDPGVSLARVAEVRNLGKSGLLQLNRSRTAHDGRGQRSVTRSISSGLHAFQRTPLLAAMHFLGKTYQEKTVFLQRRVSSTVLVLMTCIRLLRVCFLPAKTMKEDFVARCLIRKNSIKIFRVGSSAEPQGCYRTIGRADVETLVCPGLISLEG
jgi:hypothetical protein